MEVDMTMPCERTRSITHTGDFLRDLSKNPSVPESIRRKAKHLLRHYPEPWIVLSIGQFEELLQSTAPDDPKRETAIQLHSAMLSSSLEH
jgi:hypothetical protein